MPTGVRDRYHIGLNNIGFMLRGGPDQPAYVKERAADLARQLPIEELAYNPLTASGWRSWAQTDWSGGFQQLRWKDNASFRDGQGINPIKEYGSVTLQHDFTSAISITGGHKYGAHQVHDGDLILGTISAGQAKLLKITSANSLSTLSAMVGMSAVNSMSRFNDDTLIGMSRPSGSIKTLAVYRNGAVSGIRNTNHIVRAVKGIGIRAYTAEKVTALSGDQLFYSTDLSTFTSAYNAGKNRKIQYIEDLAGVPYFFIVDGQKVEMLRWSELSEKAFHIYTWDNLTNFGVENFLTYLVITGTSNGESIAFAFNGATLRQIFKDQVLDSSYDFSKPFQFEGNLHTKGALWDGQFWFPGLYGKYKGVQYTPFANFANKAYGFAVSGQLNLGYYDTTKYQVSGHVESSNFGHKIGAVDKLVNSVTVNCKALAANQTIEVFRSTNEGSTFTSIGTLSHSTDGAISNKKLYFPSGFVTKNWLYKAQLVGPGTSTPTLQDISHEWMPEPDTKRRWGLSIDAGNNVMLLNRQQEQRDGKAIMAQLWNEKEQKRTITFEDVDYISAAIISAMTSADTSARVNNTGGFPPKGRIRVVSGGVAEEMTYTSANGGTIAGITRGQKGTLARAYTSAQSFDNAYTVIITDIKERINNTDENKTESIAQLTLLEV